MRVVAILAAYNEARFIKQSLQHFLRNGVEVVLVDNQSTDATRDITAEFLGHGLTKIYTQARSGLNEWEAMLRLKEQIALETDADWFVHADPDELRLSPDSSYTLEEALARADRDGYNAVNFVEYTFVPTLQSPDHDHANFADSMRWYYAFVPRYPHRLNAWKKSSAGTAIGLAHSGGHSVCFPGLRPYPIDFKMKHYLILSLAHAMEKYGQRAYPADELERGWHGWRHRPERNQFRLPNRAELREFEHDNALDDSDAKRHHLIIN